LFAAAAAITAIALAGVTRIVVSTSFVTNLAADNPIRVSSDAFDRELGGSTTFHVVVEAGSPDAFKQPENLRVVRALQNWLDAQPEVSKTTSIADYLMQVHRAFRGGDPEAFVLPDSRATISQFLFFFWYPGSGFVTPRFWTHHDPGAGRGPRRSTAYRPRRGPLHSCRRLRRPRHRRPC
jgi:hypothetical protein